MKLKEQNTKTEESKSKLVMKQTAIDNLVTNKNDVMEKQQDVTETWVQSLTKIKLICSLYW